MKRDYAFYVYILSNPGRTVLYIGFTENMVRRLQEHIDNKGTKKSFAGKYNCTDIIYYEVYQYVNDAIGREKQLKKWSRSKKELLIKGHNPTLSSLNREFVIEE